MKFCKTTARYVFIQQGQEYYDGGGGASTVEEVFTALYDFTRQDSTQLTFKQGDQVCGPPPP